MCFWGQFITVPALNCFSEICIAERCPWLCEQVNRLRGPAALLHIHDSALRHSSSRWQTCAHDSEGSFVWACFFSSPRYFPTQCVCVCVCGSSRKPAALQNSSPSNSHYPSASHREFANIRASAQEAAHAPELSFLSTLCCAKGLQVEVKAHSASKFSIAFCGDCFETASLFPILPLPLSSSLIFFLRCWELLG